MGSRKGTVLNLRYVSRHMKSRGYLGLIWGNTAHDPRRSCDKRMSVLVLCGTPNVNEFGIDWYWATPSGYENAEGDKLPFLFMRSVLDRGLYWCPDLTYRFYGKIRETLSNYLPSLDELAINRVRMFPNRAPDSRSLVPVRPREVSMVGRLPFVHQVGGLFFDSDESLDSYLAENIRHFCRVKGTVRTNNGARRLNHWNIGPIRP